MGHHWRKLPETRQQRDERVDGNNNYVILTILKNSEPQIRSRTGTIEKAKDAWNELKKAYEGRTATEFRALLDSLYMHYDDRWPKDHHLRPYS